MKRNQDLLCYYGDSTVLCSIDFFGGAEGDISFRNCEKFNKGETTNQRMPNAWVMLRLILTMVGRKLSRNPNTYSSVLGLLWSLISFK